MGQKFKPFEGDTIENLWWDALDSAGVLKDVTELVDAFLRTARDRDSFSGRMKRSLTDAGLRRPSPSLTEKREQNDGRRAASYSPTCFLSVGGVAVDDRLAMRGSFIGVSFDSADDVLFEDNGGPSFEDV